MGSLNPGVTYIYERVNNTIYAREMGKTKREIIGHQGIPATTVLFSEWNDILRTAETNPALQEAIDRVKILYNLSRPHE